MFRNNKGITLIVLVVTIIILIILLSVSFTFILGENNIIDFSKGYVSASKKEILFDEINTLLLKYKLLKMDDKNLTITEYFNSFDESEGFSSILNNKNGTYTLLKDDAEILINESEVLDVK